MLKRPKHTHLCLTAMAVLMMTTTVQAAPPDGETGADPAAAEQATPPPAAAKPQPVAPSVMPSPRAQDAGRERPSRGEPREPSRQPTAAPAEEAPTDSGRTRTEERPRVRPTDRPTDRGDVGERPRRRDEERQPTAAPTPTPPPATRPTAAPTPVTPPAARPTIAPQNAPTRTMPGIFGSDIPGATPPPKNRNIFGTPERTRPVDATLPGDRPGRGTPDRADRDAGERVKDYGNRPERPTNDPRERRFDRAGDQPNGQPDNRRFRGVGEAPPPPGRAGPAPQNLRDIQRTRGRERDIGGGREAIVEGDQRVIVRQGNRIVIDQNENRRLRRFAPDARTERGDGGISRTVVGRAGGPEIVSETDRNGRLLRRYRRHEGREEVLIDNRRRKGSKIGRNIAIGAGIGVGVVAGAVLLDSLINVPPPRVRIPRDKYIVDYGRASEDDVYDALSAPPVDRYEDRYTLDEIRATQRLRDRMRRVDLDDITFDFGSWQLGRDEYDRLERIARAMRRVIRRNSDEVFLIEGHTDAVGSRIDNLTLSDRRAEEVAMVLVNEFKVPFENLVTQGYGEDDLKIRTQAPERENRRVAVRRITPLLNREPRTSRYEDDRGSDRDPRDDYDRRGYDEDRRGDDRRYEDDRASPSRY